MGEDQALVLDALGIGEKGWIAGGGADYLAHAPQRSVLPRLESRISARTTSKRRSTRSSATASIVGGGLFALDATGANLEVACSLDEEE